MAHQQQQQGAAQGQQEAAKEPSRLENAMINAKYLALGSSAAVVPKSLGTRSALNTTRYVLRYAIRRLLRYAKYAAVGALIAAVGGTLLGTLGSGLAFFAAPGIFGGMGIGLVTAIVKFGWRHRGNHFRWGQMKARAEAGADGAADEEADAAAVEEAGKREMHRRREDVWMRV